MRFLMMSEHDTEKSAITSAVYPKASATKHGRRSIITSSPWRMEQRGRFSPIIGYEKKGSPSIAVMTESARLFSKSSGQMISSLASYSTAWNIGRGASL